MDHKELLALFSGYGYQVRFVENIQDIDTDLYCSMTWAIDEIQKIQRAARSGKPITKPRWPMLILRTPKVSEIRRFCSLNISDGMARDGPGPNSCMALLSKVHSILIKFHSQKQSRTRTS